MKHVGIVKKCGHPGVNKQEDNIGPSQDKEHELNFFKRPYCSIWILVGKISREKKSVQGIPLSVP